MIHRLILCIAVVGLMRQAAAAEIDAAYLRGSHPAHDVIQTPAQEWNAAPSRVPSLPPPNTLTSPEWSWTGFYGGVHAGAAAGTANFADPFGPSIFGDNVNTPGFLGGGQIGFNWQIPNSSFVLGIEADASWLASDGTNTCLAFSGSFVSANCRSQPNMMGDFTARVGWAYGRLDHSLIYLKGGAALLRNSFDITTNATPDFGINSLNAHSNLSEVGWIAGVGIEHAIAPAWSVKIEYDYIGLPSQTVATPQGLVQPIPAVNGYNLSAAGTTRVTQNFQEVSLGLNYKLGMDPTLVWASATPAFPFPPPLIPLTSSGWEFDAGARSWYSSGTFQKNLGSTTNPALASTLNSRLTYDTTAGSGELFGRLESPQNIFIKGNVGMGSLLSGQLNDEDWVAIRRHRPILKYIVVGPGQH